MRGGSGEHHSAGGEPEPAVAEAAVQPGPALTGAEARAHTREFLTAQGLPEGQQMDAALLVVTELVTNAQRHAGGVRAFRLARTDTGVRVTVEDASPRSPVDRASPAWQPGGFGWPLIHELAAKVEVEALPQGKAVHAHLELDG
ncbi:ATP-binding protein [Streptomyces sp. NPDC048507]|uniref:ATP-binding protein n=1 Tax=Streptomyces sp. NPDC048507 TaxID=3365560 RepID=UPI003724B627